MIICVDVGNTTILFGVYDNEKMDIFKLEDDKFYINIEGDLYRYNFLNN